MNGKYPSLPSVQNASDRTYIYRFWWELFCFRKFSRKVLCLVDLVQFPEKHNLRLVVNMADSCWLLKFWIHVLSYWRVLEFNLNFLVLSLLTLPLCNRPNEGYSQRADLRRKKNWSIISCHLFKSNNYQRFHATIAIKNSCLWM